MKRILLLTLLSVAGADVYLHWPRGSNNRCDELNNDRRNANRLFDSQNNAAGGYATNEGRSMIFYEGTDIPIQLTLQHACGEVFKDSGLQNDCSVVIQVGCESAFTQFSDLTQSYRLTDGLTLGRSDADPFIVFGDTCTETRPTRSSCESFTDNVRCDTLDLTTADGRNEFNTACQCSKKKEKTYGLHEPEVYYDACRIRERNRGLFTADRKLRDTATSTRQNPNAARYGFECAEERDYYPYWHPSPWTDVSVLVSNIDMCNTLKDEEVCECSNIIDNNAVDCKAASASWTCTVRPKPQCLQIPRSIDNRLGGNDSDDITYYRWTLPAGLIPDEKTSEKCVLRVRYNISSTEVRGLDARDNTNLKANPVVDTAGGPMRLAINPSQYGRTFQDRSEVFIISRRTPELAGAMIHNLGVRGKRGNIAQVRNCVEYDFIPSHMDVNVGDHIHFQWSGSDFNPPGNAGEGRRGTDRSNIVQIDSRGENLPVVNATGIFSDHDLAHLALIDQRDCFSESDMRSVRSEKDQDPRSCHFLNGARDSNGRPTAYFSHIAHVSNSGTFFYMSTRNNNFSNRSQKGSITAHSTLSAGAIAGIVIGSLSLASAAVAGGIVLYNKRGRRL